MFGVGLKVPWPEPFRANCETCGLELRAPNAASIVERLTSHEAEKHPEVRELRVRALVAEVGVENAYGLTDEERRRYLHMGL